METNRPCPCGRPLSLEKCCGRYISGEAIPETPEDLMRSRYTAFATHAIAYLVDTHHPDTRGEIDRAEVERYSRGMQWLRLDVLACEEGQAGDEQGWVEFMARFRQGKDEKLHHERSLFRRHHGRWFFHSAHEPTRAPAVREQPKVGRNQPCPCGSGKKYKKCCGAGA